MTTTASLLRGRTRVLASAFVIAALMLPVTSLAGPITWTVDVTNGTGMAADDFHVNFTGTGGTVANTRVAANAPGAGPSTISGSGNAVEITWGAGGLPAGGTFTFEFSTDFREIALNAGEWTFDAQPNVPLDSARDVFSRAYFKPELASFYQHQKSDQKVGAPPVPYQTDPPPAPLAAGYNQTWDHDGNALTPDVSRNWWESGGGWCGTTAWIDSFHYWDRNGFSGVFDHTALGPEHANKDWLERFTYANEDLAIRAGAGAGGGCATAPNHDRDRTPGTLIPTYLGDYGYGADKLVYAEYYWDAGKVKQRTPAPTGGGKDVETAFATMFDLYYEELLRSEDVVVIMEGLGAWWWSPGVTGFHVVTGGGIDVDAGARRLWFADPDRGDGGSGWGFPYDSTDPLPVGRASFIEGTLAADGRTWATGPYVGARIVEIHTVSPVPEPSAYLLVGLGVLAVLVRRRGFWPWPRRLHVRQSAGQ
jgi:hypothetical protein